MALTLDELPLLLKFQDVYWRDEGVALIQGGAGLSILVALALRLLGRGEKDGSSAPASETEAG